MKQSKFPEVHIVKILSEQNQWKTVNEICLDYGISKPTFYKCKSKYGGMEAHQLSQLK
jgi:putative transposase